MTRSVFVALTTLALTSSFTSRPASAALPPPTATLSPCEIPGVAGGGKCGHYEVFENRQTRSGRKIPLKIVVLPATGSDPAPDPFVFFAGGPGEAATGTAAEFAGFFSLLRVRRDVVLIDVRGTGGSDALMCPELAEPRGVQGFLDEFMPVEAVARCAAQLSNGRDLTQYTTDNATDDVAEALRAMGYSRANLMGGSYGTRAVQIFLRRHPEMVRTIVLQGVDPTDERGPLYFAQHAQRALDGLVAECAGDPACKAAFPELAKELAALFTRLESGPVTAQILDSHTGEPIWVRLSKNGLAQTLRYMLYVPAAAVAIPLQVHAAANGNFVPLAETAHLFASQLSSMSDGFYLAAVCAEDVAFIDPAEVEHASRGTFLGDFRARQQLAACAVWPAAKLPPSTMTPVDSPVPALLISGERDPVTPPSGAERVARHLPNALHLVIADGSHGLGGMEGIDCFGDLLTRFIEAGTTKNLDTSCLATVKRPAFLTALPPAPIELSVDQLRPFVGTYTAPEVGLEVTVELVGTRLRAVIIGEGSNLLLPLTSTRFAIAGAPPGFILAFELDGNRVTGATVEQGPGTRTRLVPKTTG